MPDTKPTRRDLLRVIGRLQHLIGRTMAATSDRNPNRAQELTTLLDRAHGLCIEAVGFDDPKASMPNGKDWGDDSHDLDGVERRR